MVKNNILKNSPSHKKIDLKIQKTQNSMLKKTKCLFLISLLLSFYCFFALENVWANDNVEPTEGWNGLGCEMFEKLFSTAVLMIVYLELLLIYVFQEFFTPLLNI